MSEWIDCKKQLPGECESVLAAGKGGKVFNLYRQNGDWFVDGPYLPERGNHAPAAKFQVTHWQPLPSPPAE